MKKIKVFFLALCALIVALTLVFTVLSFWQGFQISWVKYFDTEVTEHGWAASKLNSLEVTLMWGGMAVRFDRGVMTYKPNPVDEFNVREVYPWRYPYIIRVITPSSKSDAEEYQSVCGFGFESVALKDRGKDGGLRYRFFSVTFPIPLFLIFGLPVAIFAFKKWKRARKLRLGLCLGCGYDLRHSDTCPECGVAKT